MAERNKNHALPKRNKSLIPHLRTVTTTSKNSPILRRNGLSLFLCHHWLLLLYAIHYFGYPGNKRDQYSEYERKVAAFEEKKSDMQSSASGAAEMSEAEILAAGGTLYTEKGCLACHGLNGEGNAIGPNLTDQFWLNGCSMEEVIKIISEGKPEKE